MAKTQLTKSEHLENSITWNQVAAFRLARHHLVERAPLEDEPTKGLADVQMDLRKPRCMTCGGELEIVDKASVLERIPPKTRRWRPYQERS